MRSHVQIRNLYRGDSHLLVMSPDPSSVGNWEGDLPKVNAAAITLTGRLTKHWARAYGETSRWRSGRRT